MQKPWINNFQSNGFEGACIACCNRKAVGRCCGCNISIRLSDSLSGYSSAHHQFRVKLRRSEAAPPLLMTASRSGECCIRGFLYFLAMAAAIARRTRRVICRSIVAFEVGLIRPSLLNLPLHLMAVQSKFRCEPLTSQNDQGRLDRSHADRRGPHPFTLGRKRMVHRKQ